MNASIDLGVDAFPMITGIVTVAGEIIKLTTEEIEWFNSPEMRAARHNVLLQRDRDRARANMADALKTGDVTKLNEDLQ